MNRHMEQTTFFQALGALAAFILWTAAICYVDVRPIGPEGSAVGFAALNGAFHQFTGVHMALYVITDWLGLFPVAVGFAFGLLGLKQLLQRKRLQLVDPDILALGAFYLLVIGMYLLFENLPARTHPGDFRGILSFFHHVADPVRYGYGPYAAETTHPQTLAAEKSVVSGGSVYRLYGNGQTFFRCSLAHGYCGRHIPRRRVAVAVSLGSRVAFLETVRAEPILMCTRAQ